MLKLIPKNAGRVIEFGCGAGSLGKEYKVFNPNAEFIGFEINEDLKDRTTENLDKVFFGDVEQMNLSDCGIAEKSVDCLVYGDVLEHLKDPVEALKHHLKYLSDDGTLVTCIPHVGHWSILLGLMHGSWQYSYSGGLLDYTHLRFFTRQTVMWMFEQVDMTVVDLVSRRANERAPIAGMYLKDFLEKMRPSIEAFGIDFNKFAVQVSGYQFLVRAKKKEAAKLKHIFIHSLMLKPTAACNDVRILEPNDFIGSQPGVIVHNEVSVLNQEIHKSFKNKVFIYQRPILRYQSNMQALRWLVRNNYLVIIEFDDHPERWPEIEQNKYLNYRGVHAVQTSTEPLADFFRQFNPEVAIFPNQLAQLPRKRLRDSSDNSGKITVFFGALNRKDDWAPIMPAINEVIALHKDKLHFEVIFDREFFDALATEDKNFTGLCEYPVYQRLLGGADISLMPLADTMFNRMKSDLKFIEAAGHGAVALASDVLYPATLRDGETGVIFTSAEDFKHKFISLINDNEMRHNIADNAYEYVYRERLLSQHYMKRLEWYQSLLARLPELNDALRLRVPEIFQD